MQEESSAAEGMRRGMEEKGRRKMSVGWKEKNGERRCKQPEEISKCVQSINRVWLQ